MKSREGNRGCVVLALPRRNFFVDVTYKIRVRHRVTATDAQEACLLAPESEITAEMEIVDILDSIVVAER